MTRPRFPGGFKYIERKRKAKPSFFRYKKIKKVGAVAESLDRRFKNCKGEIQ